MAVYCCAVFPVYSSGNLLRPESVDIIVNILNVTQLLGECLVLLENTESQVC